MSFIHIVTLGLLQGITEFLPISSSAHLILVPALTNWPDQGPLIDVAVHVGTLGAVIVYFRRDVGLMLRGALSWVGWTVRTEDQRWGRRLAGLLVVATIPVVVVGLIFELTGISAALRDMRVIAWASILFGIVLYYADRVGATERRVADLRLGSALWIGLSQALALIPGTSRSGITMTTARFLGFSRAESAHFSMLLSIPTIIAAGSLSGLEIYERGDPAFSLDALMSAGLAFVTALAAIALLMRWLKRADFTPFVIYRVGLGLVLLWLSAG